MIFLKKINFCWSFLPSWIRIRIPNTDPDSDYGSGSETLALTLMNVQVALGPGITVTPAGGAGYKTWEVIKGHQAGSQSPP